MIEFVILVQVNRMDFALRWSPPVLVRIASISAQTWIVLDNPINSIFIQKLRRLVSFGSKALSVAEKVFFLFLVGRLKQARLGRILVHRKITNLYFWCVFKLITFSYQRLHANITWRSFMLASLLLVIYSRNCGHASSVDTRRSWIILHRFTSQSYLAQLSLQLFDFAFGNHDLFLISYGKKGAK